MRIVKCATKARGCEAHLVPHALVATPATALIVLTALHECVAVSLHAGANTHQHSVMLQCSIGQLCMAVWNDGVGRLTRFSLQQSMPTVQYIGLMEQKCNV